MNTKAHAIIGAVIFLLAAIAILSIRLDDAHVDIANLKADAALEQVSRQAAARRFEKAISTQRAEAAAKQEESIHAYTQAVAARDRAVRDLDSVHDRLRLDLSAYLAGGDSGTGTGAAACRGDRDQAAALGDVLLSGDDLAQHLAEAAEQLADEVRLLLRQIEIDRAACAPL